MCAFRQWEIRKTKVSNFFWGTGRKWQNIKLIEELWFHSQGGHYFDKNFNKSENDQICYFNLVLLGLRGSTWVWTKVAFYCTFWTYFLASFRYQKLYKMTCCITSDTFENYQREGFPIAMEYFNPLTGTPKDICLVWPLGVRYEKYLMYSLKFIN